MRAVIHVIAHRYDKQIDGPCAQSQDDVTHLQTIGLFVFTLFLRIFTAWQRVHEEAILRRPNAVLILIVAFAGVGCLELVRRPSPEAHPGSSTSSYAGDKASEPSIKPVLQQHPKPVKEVERNKKQRRSIQQVNEYALWCIENEMWNEARTHMERALQEDSLSASLHNNLAIVYEHLGKADRAGYFYQRALDLKPAQEAYRSNLSNLRNRQQALTDTSGDFDLFRMPEDNERRRTEGLYERAVTPFSQESE